jgi:hypothetical protein
MFDPSKITIRNQLDENGKPAGGTAFVNIPFGQGHSIVARADFQEGPIKDAKGRNGAFVEDLIYIAQKRIEFYNAAGFACEENHEALRGLKIAMDALQARTARRTAQGVEGTHEGT